MEVGIVCDDISSGGYQVYEAGKQDDALSSNHDLGRDAKWRAASISVSHFTNCNRNRLLLPYW
ncbi:hypothetical protein Trco_000862 [Trichoderma cornu-damae]|uniref:Uncharacterized protein n=1 Tax=Trichoderma cornu-damae TaxID=654480 RepID=A0A9P8QY64_9HYPO|nr:hypothetical protein Trco_000862 [Trichoderma cornu-damae]